MPLGARWRSPLRRIADKAGFPYETPCHDGHTDHLGTPQELTNAEGKISWSADYSAWGERQHALILNAEEEAEQRTDCAIRFQGQYFDAETGLHYNTFRYYDPGCGRFISPDPINLLGGLNLYQYAPNAWNWIDPWGLNTEPTLPSREIVKKGEGNVTIRHKYGTSGSGRKEHAPVHAHVEGGGEYEVRIGQNGKPLAGEKPLSATQQKVVDANKSKIRQVLKKIGKWYRHQSKKTGC
ncbi:MAG: RHS domain-containing protein [Zoogloeaceae bacterium]|nr:RHS domain-containing protein [Zoogloeaceae bacterium]